MQLVLFISMGSILLISCLLVYYIYSIVLIDANSRGLKKPKLWAFLASTSSRGEGLLFYLFYRNKYSKNMVQSDREKIKKLKNKIFVLLLVDFTSFIFAVIALMNLPS